MNARLIPVESFAVTPSHSAEKEQLTQKLVELLRTSFELRSSGGTIREQATAQGYADGYIAMLLDSGMMSEREVLAIVQGARRGSFGPLASSESATVAPDVARQPLARVG